MLTDNGSISVQNLNMKNIHQLFQLNLYLVDDLLVALCHDNDLCDLRILCLRSNDTDNVEETTAQKSGNTDQNAFMVVYKNRKDISLFHIRPLLISSPGSDFPPTVR